MTNAQLHDPVSNSNPRRPLVDVSTLAAELGVTTRFVRRLVSEDRIPYLKIGKFIRFDPREIDRWIDEARQNDHRTHR